MSYANRNLASIPYATLIGAPMTAAVEAQALAAQTSVDFIQSVGFDVDSDGNMSVRNVEFTYSSKDEETDEDRTVTVKVPLLSILPIPFLRIEDMTIDFSTKITEAIERESSNSSETEASATLTASARWGVAKVGFKGSVSHNSKKENKNSSRYNTEHTMSIVVNAVQDDIPAGMSRILDMLQGAIAEDGATDPS